MTEIERLKQELAQTRAWNAAAESDVCAEYAKLANENADRAVKAEAIVEKLQNEIVERQHKETSLIYAATAALSRAEVAESALSTARAAAFREAAEAVRHEAQSYIGPTRRHIELAMNMVASAIDAKAKEDTSHG